jgi:cytochrome c oxidase cbb3-type subunit 4
MNYSLFGSVMTVVMLVVFIGIVVWAWSGKRRAAFDEAARVPLEDDMDADARITDRPAQR